jgi:hypothetical protein
MTLRFRASATIAGRELVVGYSSFPTTIKIPGDGITDTLDVPQYYPTDPDNPSRVTISVAIQNRLTGASTAATIVTKNGESNPLGGSIVVTPIATADEDYIVSRGYINKAIVDTSVLGGLTTEPKWFTVLIPPNVLKLENVTIDFRSGSYASGLFYKIHEFELVEKTELPYAPFYPAKITDSGPGQPPNNSGGWDCGWEPGVFVTALNSSRTSPPLLGWECVSTSGNGGVGSFVAVYGDRETSIVNTGTTSYTLPDPATQTIGAKRRYTNNGTATITVTAFAGGTFARCSQTVLTLGIGESVLLEYTAANVWSILGGLVSSGGIANTSGNPTQSIPTGGAATQVTWFDAVLAGAQNIAPSVTGSDTITITRAGLYRVNLFSSLAAASAGIFRYYIFVNGSVSTARCIKAMAAGAPDNFSVTRALYLAVGDVLTARILHDQAGSIVVTCYEGSFEAERIGA